MATNRVADWTSVRAKIKRDTYLELITYCRKEGITPSSFVRNLIESNVSSVVPIHHAGMNKVDYEKSDDAFSWHVEYDKGPRVTLAEQLKPEFLENFLQAANVALETRSTYLRKYSPNSVPIPTRLKKIHGVEHHVNE